MEHDIHSEIKAVSALDQQTVSGAGDVDGNTIDTVGYEGLEYIVHTGAVTVSLATVRLEEAPDNNGVPGAWAPVPAELVLGAQIAIVDADSDSVFRMGSIGKERFQRMVMVGIALDNFIVGATGVLGWPRVRPEPDQST